MNGYRIDTWTRIIFIKKERNLAIFDNMNGPGGHYLKWNKSGRKKIPYNHSPVWNLKIKEKLKIKTA